MAGNGDSDEAFDSDNDGSSDGGRDDGAEEFDSDGERMIVAITSLGDFNAEKERSEPAVSCFFVDDVGG